nr:type II toxin-antitoxin system HicB family antitoxin [uncultured Brevundimonas sp.]
MRPFAYPVRIEEPEPGEFIATFRDVPEAITGGATQAEALEQAADALTIALEGYLKVEAALPVASPAEAGEEVVFPTPALVARAALQSTMADQNLSGRALAQRLGKDEKHVRRILSGEATLDQVLKALRALGLRAEMTVA